MPSLFGTADKTSAVVYEDDQESYFYPLQQASSQDEYYEMLAKDQGWWTSSDHGAFGAVNPFYEMMYQQVLLPSIDNLYKAQYAAAQEQGYEEKFSHLKEWGDQNASTWIDNDQPDSLWMNEQFKLGSSQPTEWSMWYNDQDKDMSIAQNADELQAQLDTIAGYSDRSRVQRDFLSQKATVRYWFDQVSKFGGAQDLAENLFNNRDNQLRYASPRLATDDTIDSSFNNIVP